MLTPPGWLLLLGSALLIGAGRVFGSDELLAVGTAGGAVAILSIAYVRFRQPLRVAARSIRPQRVHVGHDCQVHIQLANSRRLRSPVLHLTDSHSFSTESATDHFQAPDLLAAPIPGGDELTVVYKLPTVKRGRLEAGPMIVKLADPLGLSVRRFEMGEPAEALVYPAVLPIKPPPRLPGSTFDAVRRSPMAQSGDELYGLRPFQTGDDPRRIHWRSSAHHDELIVRQFEEFSHTHTTVLLDTRSVLLDFEARYGDGERFEAMVSAAASICQASQNRGDQVRLATTAEFDSGYGSDAAHLHKIYEHLALVNPDMGSLFGAVERLGRAMGGGLVVAVAAAVDGTEPGSLMSLGSHFSSKTVVLFADPTGSSPPVNPNLASGPGTSVVVVDEPHEFADAWTRHTASSGGPGSGTSAGAEPTASAGWNRSP